MQGMEQWALIISNELDNAIVINDFPVLDLSDKVNKDFFAYYSQLPLFNSMAISASEGTTNRRMLKLDRFYNITLRLSSIDEQINIISTLKSVESTSF